MRRHLASWVAISALAAFALGGCSSAPPAASTDARVTVIPDTTALTLTPDSVAFIRTGNEALAARAPGDLVVSAQGEGFLRRVLAVHHDADTDQVILDTEPAALGDAVIDGDVSDSLALRDGTSGASPDGKWDTHTLQLINVDLRAQRPIDNANLTVDIHRAALSLRPTLDLDLAMRGRRLEHFEAVLSSQLDADLDLEVRARAGTIKPAIKLWKSPPMIFYQQVGVVPVVETAVISVGVRLEITARGDSRVRLKGSLRSALAAGLRYEGGQWQRGADASNSLTGSIPAADLDVDQIDVRAYLFTQLDVKFYDVAGPFISVGPYVQVDHPLDSPAFAAKVGLYGEVGGELKVFGIRVPALPRFQLFDVSRPLFSTEGAR